MKIYVIITSLTDNQLNVFNPAHIYLFKVNNRNFNIRCGLYSKLTIKTPERRQWRRSGVFAVNFEHISNLFLVFLLLTLNKYMLAGNIDSHCFTYLTFFTCTTDRVNSLMLCWQPTYHKLDWTNCISNSYYSFLMTCLSEIMATDLIKKQENTMWTHNLEDFTRKYYELLV